MRYLVSAKEMKEIDKRSIEEYGIPSLVLMERAALEVAKEAEKLLTERQTARIWAVCGLGNNGADGVAAARMLFLKGYQVSILLPETEKDGTEEMEVQLKIAEKLGIPVYTVGDFIPGTCDLILDAVFGIGLSRRIEGVYQALVELIRSQKQAAVVAVDMPSGINSDTGAVMGCAVEADVTVTFGEKKLGQALFPGRRACGRLVVADIGFVPETKEQTEKHVLSYETEDLARIPQRRIDGHKGSFGRVLIVGGAVNMAGAPCFSALAAYRTGAGLVKVMTAKENRGIMQQLLPEALLFTYDTVWACRNPEEFKDRIRSQVQWADVIVLGPGLGQEEYAKTLVETVLSDAYVPIVMDADAINLAAGHSYLKGYFTENIILTPHILEFSRLTGKEPGEIKADPVGCARELSDQYGVTCVLKDAATVTARKDGKVFVNTSGSPALAKGGSGDVLAGVIAGLLAIGMDDCEAASLGVYVHGLAGQAAEERFGAHSVLARETADCLGKIINFGEAVRLGEVEHGRI